MSDPTLQLPDAPPEVVALGAPEQVHPSSTAVLWWLGFAGLGCFGPAGMCFYFLVAPFGKNPPPPEVALAVGCVFALSGLGCLLGALLIRLSVWVLFPTALVELKGSKAQIFLWEEIAELRQEAMPHNPNMPGLAPIRYTVVARDGREREIEAKVRDRQQLTARVVERLRDRTVRPSRGGPETAERPGELLEREDWRRAQGSGRGAKEPARKPGEPISRHEVTLGGLTRRYFATLMLGGIGLALGVGFLVMSLFRPDAGAVPPGIVMTVLGSLGFLPILFWGFGGPSEAVVLESGIRWSDAKGEYEAPWSKIREVMRKEMLVNETFRQTFLKLLLEDGRMVAFDHRFSNYDRLAEEVQRRHAQSCYEKKREELSGGEARFGPVVLRPGSISVAKETIPWGNLRKFAIVNGHMMFATPGKMGDRAQGIAMYEVPNYPVLLILMEEMGRVPEGPATFFQD